MNSGGAAPVAEMTLATLNDTPLVTLFANGVPLVLVLDTGAERTVVTPAAAKRISGKAPRIEFQRGLRGIAGSLPAREIELDSFSIGGVPIRWRRVTVASITTPQVFSIALDGLLGADVLSSFDVAIDLSGHRMGLYQKGSCGNLGRSRTGQQADISAGRSRSNYLFFPVLLNGFRITAIIDTGAQRTTISTTTARALGVTEAALASDRPVKTRGAAGEELTSRAHRFARLDIGGISVSDPEIIVSDVRLRDADIVLGVDFLSSRRLCLSYSAFRIFLSDR
jgi:predicted aspartyl protease